MSDGWTLVYEGFDPRRQGLREALCTLGNGLFATRGAAEEVSADGVHYPGTYAAGVYNRLKSEVAGQTVVNEDLVNLPNWLRLDFRPEGGEAIDLASMEILEWRQELRMREGLLVRRVRIRDSQGRMTAVESRRLVHMESPHLAAISYRITPENWAGRVHVRSILDGSVTNTGVPRYRQLASKHLRIVHKCAVAPEGIHLLAETNWSLIDVGMAARTRLRRGRTWLETESRLLDTGDEVIGQEFAADVRRGEPLTVEKVVALYTSRDRGIGAPGLESRLAVTRAPDFEELLRTQRVVWASMWRRFDLDLLRADGSDETGREQLILRLHVFHLLQTVSENTIGLDVGVPARGLHGEAYRGHVFWDELFIFPFFNLRHPEITRSLLLYRYHRLDAAREYALECGYDGGAVFPWQSGSDGRETSQQLHLNPRSGRWEPDHSRLQRHVNAAIVYNLWQYWQVTGDRGFLERYGAEMILEIARFWAFAARFDAGTGRYRIRGVMGPDEYHEKYPDVERGGLDDNTYTSVMAVWCIDRAFDVLRLIREERRRDLVELLRLNDEELNRWRDITSKMRIVFHADGTLSQFAGYEGLRELDWDAYRKRYGDIHRLDRILKAAGDQPDRYKISKQADVTMLFYLLDATELERIFHRLEYPFEKHDIARNVDYYMKRTSHGSTLDLMVQSSVLDVIDRERGWTTFATALRSDIEDMQGGTTAEGIHLGAMAGTVDIVLRRFAGVDPTREILSISPRLPSRLHGIRARVHHHCTWFTVEAFHDGLRLTVEKEAPAPRTVEIWSIRHTVVPGSVTWFPRTAYPKAEELERAAPAHPEA